MKNKGKQKNNGITLIALVITIIVLLILAGVTIATLTGENGILTKASEAKEQTEIAEEKEAIGIAYNGVLADNDGNGVNATDLETELRNNGYNATVTDNGDGTLTIAFDSGRTYTVDSNGNIIGPVVSNIEATMNFVGDKMEEADIPIPNGFYHVQGTTIDDGFVISDVEGDDLNNTAGGNQFVWVPVDKNQKLEINVTSKENIKSIELMNPNGEISTLAENYEGESYSSTVENLEINGPYILKVSTETENKEIMVGVHGLYAGDTLTDWYLTDENIEKTYGEEGITDIESLIGLFQEMGYEINTIWDLYKFYGENMNQMRYIIDTDYTDSVKSNGGFYIGRFEASEENEKVVCKKNRTSWTLSYSESLSNTNKMYTSNEYTSTLLTGAAWDRTLLWLYETGEKTLSEIVNDSTSWGIYSTDRINTGSDEKTSANNIYDLAGNWREWTTEGSVGNSDDKYARGGAYTISNSDSSAMNRKLLNAIITSSQIAGFRPALFLAVPNE